MKKPAQKRTLATRAKLIAAAQMQIAASTYTALRVEEVVQEAGVAKGTFFAHFRDKDALMDLIIGGEIDHHLDHIEQQAAPEDLDTLITALMPLLGFMTSERYVFDVIIRHSGAAAKEDVGPIARTFERQFMVFAKWLAAASFRRDVAPDLLAEGIQAFVIQVVALHFCAINSDTPMQTRLRTYLQAWLMPPNGSA